MILTVPLLAVLLAVPPADLSKARRDLTSAIGKAEPQKAQPAIDTLKKLATPEAISAVLRGIEQTRKEFDKVQAKVDRLQKLETARPMTEQEKKRNRRTLSREFRDHMATFTLLMGNLNTIQSALTNALRLMNSDEAVEEFIRRVKEDSDADVRARMAHALRGRKQPEVLPALLERLGEERNADVLVGLLDALPSRKKSPNQILDAVFPHLESKTWTVIVAAAAALQRQGSTRAIAPLIETLERVDGRVRADVNAALVALTRVDKHGEPAAWKDWWERNREAVLAGTYKPVPAERAGGAAGGTTFYGLPVVSRHPVFVIDASLSMKRESQWKPAPDAPVPGDLKLAGDRKIDVAQFELKKVLMMMPDGVEFNIVFFHRDVDAFSPHMVTLNKKTRRQAIEWIDGLVLVLQTNIWEGLRRAFTYAASAKKGSLTSRSTVASGADTIYLLSDGAPTTGIKKGNDLCKAVAEVNRTKKVVIHTIAIEPRANGERFMKKLARENDGKYAKRGEAPPKK